MSASEVIGVELSGSGISGVSGVEDLACGPNGNTFRGETFSGDLIAGDLIALTTDEAHTAPAPQRAATPQRTAATQRTTATQRATATQRTPAATDPAELVELHESTAGLLADKGDYRAAYEHLRSALELLRQAGGTANGGSPIPEQLRREVDRLRRERAEAHEQSIRDSLTASYNRRYLDERLTSLLGDRRASAPGVAVALIDLDLFKRVNDTFGHLVGDRVLQRTVELLCAELPAGAFCARYGGEEFILVMPRIDAPGAVRVAEAARVRVAGYPWPKLMPGLHVTISAGVVHEPTGGAAHGYPPIDAELQLLRADGLLYTAKQSGRNAVAYRTAAGVHISGESPMRRIVTQSRNRDNT